MSDLDALIEHCHNWAESLHAAIGSGGVYIFGSAVQRGGDQFDPGRSDLDLVVIIPSNLLAAHERTEWLVHLYKLKHELEVSLIPMLGRADASTQIVSVVPLTAYELRRDIHKSRVRNFFRANAFTDLLESATAAPLLRRAPARVHDLTRHVSESVQDIRNKFLSVSASGGRPLHSPSDRDPVPKDLMRQAAMATSVGGRTAKDADFDVKHGLDKLTRFVYDRAELDPSYAELSDWISIRRGARGSAVELAPERYLLLAEVIFDMSRRRPRSRRKARGARDKVKGRRAARRGQEDQITRVNGYKLFYYRQNHKLTLTALARTAGVPKSLLWRLERVYQKKGKLDSSWFHPCERKVLARLESALGCQGQLEAGKQDDFLTRYMIFYKTNRGVLPSERRNPDSLAVSFETRAVVFDFDGTLTQSADHRTTWEKVWVTLGYSTERCSELHRRFQQKEFTHQQWCDMTRDAFRARGLQQHHILGIAKDISLVSGVAEAIATLRGRGIKLYILSGSIKSIIRYVLGDLHAEFEEIRANELVFDSSGSLSEIQGTPFDFEGKATYLKRVVEDLRLSPSDLLFVGNSCNDVFASQSGARTLCVNARFTDPDNPEHWTYAIREMSNLNEIMRFVQV